jgi:transposase
LASNPRGAKAALDKLQARKRRSSKRRRRRTASLDKLIEVREVAVAKVAAMDKEIRRFVRDDLTLRRFMTVHGVGPATALAFRSTIDEPNRFKRARDVGPYLRPLA